MSYILLFEDQVFTEYSKGFDYYHEISDELGQRFEQDFKNTLLYLKQ